MSVVKPEIYCVGVSHRSAPVAIREKLYIDPESLRPLLHRLSDQFNFDELLVLSTCNRFELLIIAKREDLSDDLVFKAYRELQSLAKKAQLSMETYQKHLYSFKGISAIEHMFAVVASLDSLVIGETQITGQFKEAMKSSLLAGTLGSYLDRLGQDALSCAKKVRTQTKIGEKKVSISHAAIDLAKRVFKNLEEHRVLMIGSGEMAQVAAAYVCKYNPKDLVVLNRTFMKGQALINKLGYGQAVAWECLSEELVKADIVISSTAANEPVITFQDLKQVMNARQGRSIFLVDIAIPRDIEPRCSDLDDVYLFEIDDLQKVVDGNLEARRIAGEEGRSIVATKAQHYQSWLNSVSIKPIFSDFRHYIDDLFHRELEKTIGKLVFQDLSKQQLASLKSMMDAIAGKLVGDVAKSINIHEDLHYKEQLALSLSALFPAKFGATAAEGFMNKNEDSQEDLIECKQKMIQI